MTDSQWIFHAAEIGMRKKEDLDLQLDICEAYIERLEDASHMSGIFARSDIKFDTVKNAINTNDEKRQKLYAKRHKVEKSVRDTLMSEFNEVKDVAPEVLEVEEIDTFVQSMPKVKVSRKRRNRNGRE